MVKVTFYQSREGQITGFDCIGHADYAEGGDIVCAAVSALTITCVNSVGELTADPFRCDADEESGKIVFRMEESGESSQLLLKSLLLGLQQVEDNYDAYVDVIIEEV